MKEPHQLYAITLQLVIMQVVHDTLYYLASAGFNGSALPHAALDGGSTLERQLPITIKSHLGIEATDIVSQQQLPAYLEPATSPGRPASLTINYICTGFGLRLSGLGRQSGLHFVAISNTDDLVPDQAGLVDQAVNALRMQVDTSKTIAALMPGEFTLTMLQQTYEALFETKLDIRNFRKTISSQDMLEATEGFQSGSAHRRARLYRYKPSI